MDINTFYSYNLGERLDVVNRSGEFISRIRHYGFYIHLYSVEGQYVEVYYNAHSNEIEDADILDPLDEKLNLYSVQVNLSDLFK
jgi:hypothetical protein